MFELFYQLHPFVFLLSFSIGTYLCYAYSPKPQRVIKKPTPANNQQTIYMDSQGSCYRYQTNSIACTKTIPILIDEESL